MRKIRAVVDGRYSLERVRSIQDCWSRWLGVATNISVAILLAIFMSRARLLFSLVFLTEKPLQVYDPVCQRADVCFRIWFPPFVVVPNDAFLAKAIALGTLCLPCQNDTPSPPITT